ncbi:MAG: hypothetical protein CMH57_05365 [Myxococcales bacterium]|nr:hypothetical protein [Myxococcales bacterium]
MEFLQSESIMIAVAVALVLGVLYYILTRNQSERQSKRPYTPPAPGSSVRRNWLVGKGGSVQGKNYHIGSRTVTIGRGIGNYVQITDPNASRIHCKLSPVPYGLEVRDNDSRNGTMVNNKRITVQVLKDGDELKIGDDAFTYHAEGNFGENAGLKRKTADARVGKATVMEGTDFKTMISDALVENNGDVEAAAKSLGVTREAFEAMLKKQGLDNKG